MSSKDKYGIELEIPDNVVVKKEDQLISVTGKKGTIIRDFHKLAAFITIENNTIEIEPAGKRKRDLAMTNTARSILKNMFKGVENGFRYKLKIVFAHFPISVKVKEREVHVENFFGERSARVSRIVGDGTNVTIKGDDVIVEGPSLEDVSQTAANIESSTKVKGKDQRVFLDGLYIYSRDGGD